MGRAALVARGGVARHPVAPACARMETGKHGIAGARRSDGGARRHLTSLRNFVRDLKGGGLAPSLSATSFLLEAFHAPEDGSAVDPGARDAACARREPAAFRHSG